MLGVVDDLLLRLGIIGVETEREIFIELIGSGGRVLASLRGLERSPFELSLYDNIAASNSFNTL
jgi:hypothetical protein